MSKAHIHEMGKSTINLIAISMLFIEVDQPNGFWTYLGGGILLINIIHFIKSEFNEQENN
jgi:hypothetical protein